MSTLTQKMAQVQYFWVSEHFEWMFSLLTKDSEGNADVFFFSEDFSYKNGRKKQQQDGLRSIPLIDFDPRWLLPIPFSLGWMFRWIHLPMVPDPYGYRSLSTLVLECFRMTKGSSWDFLFQPVPCFWYSREENHIHTIIMNHGLIELGDCVCTSL